MLMANSWKQKLTPYDSPTLFMFPHEEFIKLNFDRAAKENTGAKGTGGVFWDHQGSTIGLYAMDCGITSNNEA